MDANVDKIIRGLLSRFATVDISTIDRKWLTEVRSELERLEYFITPKGGYIPTEKIKITHVACSTEGCQVTSQTLDACLIQINGRWFCRDHHPKREDGVKPVGYVPPQAERDKTEEKTKEALKKLSPEERSLVNRNIVR